MQTQRGRPREADPEADETQSAAAHTSSKVCVHCHGLHSGASICGAVLCVAAQRTRRAHCGGAHPAFSPAKLKLPHRERAVDKGVSTTVWMGPAGSKSTNGRGPAHQGAFDAP
ncbi:hypothetical protein TARUN_7043 [Trichoderma arundinaceum]|uniref:Uncharacterized protein n=1 Tax=Trichoderma arundinaceum TaxID=490622 RepID=A0A395NH02_TRIAR|nr:hypothetical protein TARUN_7043 [Trichoderma arundinaceum]